jgi:hypothetical protein
MKYLRLFESFEFDDIFNDKLWRGLRLANDRSELIDDPSKRKVNLGSVSEYDPEYETYSFFLNRFTRFGIPNPTKSVHMVFGDDFGTIRMLYGNTFKVIPQTGSQFGYCRKKLLLEDKRDYNLIGVGMIWYRSEVIGQYLLGKKYPNFQKIPDQEARKYYDSYISDLIDRGVVGKMSYDELVRLSETSDDVLYIWTESPCHLTRKNDLNNETFKTI